MKARTKKWIGIALAAIGLIGIIVNIRDTLLDPKVEAAAILGFVIWSGTIIGGFGAIWFPDRFTGL